MTWIIDIVRGLRALGGEAKLPDLYKWIKRNRKEELPPSWQEGIRAALQAHCSEAKQYRQGNPNLFSHTGHGWWAIRKIDETSGAKLPISDLMSLAIQRMTDSERTEAIKSPNFLEFLNQKAEQVKHDLLRG